MSNFAVKVRRVIVMPHPNADRLELGTVDDYHVVIAKGEYQTGDLAVYIPEQAVVPEPIIAALGLEGKLHGADHNRVRAMMLQHTDGTSALAAHMREGVVIRPTHEREDPEIGRVILKSVSGDYLTRKGGTELQ